MFGHGWFQVMHAWLINNDTLGVPALDQCAHAQCQQLCVLCSYNWGDPVGKWGYQHHVDTAEECCAACQNYQPAKADDMDCNGVPHHVLISRYMRLLCCSSC